MMNAVPTLRRCTQRRGFTLVELLTVIAIIGILATILIPAVGGVRKRANMTKSSSNLRQIGLGFQAFSTGGNRVLTISEGAWANGGTRANTPGQWAQVLADRADLNDASLYIIDSDPAVGGLRVPKVIGNKSGTTFTPDTAWTALDTNNAVGYEFVVGMSVNAPSSTTPLAWTRGLQSNGRWESSGSVTAPWGEEDGGHILFMDAHVEAHKDLLGEPDDSGTRTPVLVVGQGVSGSAGQPTADINQASKSWDNAGNKVLRY